MTSGTLLQNLTYEIRNAFENIQIPHTRDYFASEIVPHKSHIDNNVCWHKLTAAVALYPRNTELQLTEDGAYQVAFEMEFDIPVGLVLCHLCTQDMNNITK